MLDSASIARVIENGIKRPIRVLLDQNCYPAALILTYSGMEMMAFFNMPCDKPDVTRSDFIDWADTCMIRYLPRDITGREIVGKDLYAARCGALRGTDARLAREGHCRRIRYSGDSGDAIRLEVKVIVEAFFAAVDVFLADLALDEKRAATASRRLDEMLTTLPF